MALAPILPYSDRLQTLVFALLSVLSFHSRLKFETWRPVCTLGRSLIGGDGGEASSKVEASQHSQVNSGWVNRFFESGSDFGGNT